MATCDHVLFKNKMKRE